MSPHQLNEFEAKRRDLLTSQAMRSLRSTGPIRMELDPGAALSLIANLQLALRHPGNNGPSAQLARKIVGEMIDQLPEDVREFAMLGFDERYDVAVEQGQPQPPTRSQAWLEQQREHDAIAEEVLEIVETREVGNTIPPGREIGNTILPPDETPTGVSNT